MRPSVYIGLLTQRPCIRILRDFLVRTQTMSGWNDGGRGEKGNRRMFDPAEEVSGGDEDAFDMERAFNFTRTQEEEGDRDSDSLGRCGREIQTSVLSCLTS